MSGYRPTGMTRHTGRWPGSLRRGTVVAEQELVEAQSATWLALRDAAYVDRLMPVLRLAVKLYFSSGHAADSSNRPSVRALAKAALGPVQSWL